MSLINATSLEATLASAIATVNASSLENVYSLIDANNVINVDAMFYVQTANDLPDLATVPIPNGQIVYVNSISLHVISWNYKWISFDGRVYRDDSNVNTIWSWGCAGNGRLGDDTSLDKSSPVSVVGGFTDWCQVSVGGSHTSAVRTNGTIWAWGQGSAGKLGDNSTTSKSSPVSVVGGFTDWCQVSVGGSHTSAVRTNGTIWAWGSNADGKLGDNTATSKSSPVSVVGGFTDWCQVSAGGSHTSAVRTNGTIWAWGSNEFGKLGDNSTTSKSSPVSVVGGFTDWCQVSAGCAHSLAVRTNGTIWAWGSNGAGRLGDNTTVSTSSPVSVVGGFTDWCQVSAGIQHTAAVRTNGTIWTWGSNGAGILGDNTIANKSSPVSVVGGFTDWCQVSAGDYHTAAVRTNGTIWTWGSGGSGRLGSDTITTKSSPVSVVGGFTDWCQVSAGVYHTAAIRTT
jgi:alpha-tubulin suppressor-like RCC1 family protein